MHRGLFSCVRSRSAAAATGSPPTPNECSAAMKGRWSRAVTLRKKCPGYVSFCAIRLTVLLPWCPGNPGDPGKVLVTSLAELMHDMYCYRRAVLFRIGHPLSSVDRYGIQNGGLYHALKVSVDSLGSDLAILHSSFSCGLFPATYPRERMS